MPISRTARLLVPLCLLPVIAFAHPGHDAQALLSGLTHPIGGFDHVLVMLAVGVLAGRRGGAAIWRLPATFVGAMLVGGWLGANAAPTSLVETGIALSVVAVGAVFALGRPISLAAVSAVTAAFALFHGYAHGVEMEPGGGAAPYAFGFVLATALLHLCGIALARLIDLKPQWAPHVFRVGGAVIGMAGLGVLALRI